MAGINKVILIGNLGKDPDIITLENNVKKASFTLATTETYRDKDGNRVDQTEWHNIVLWRGLAEIAEKYLKKGSTIYLEGRIRTRSYEVNGVKKYITEILGDNFLMLGRREISEGPQIQPPQIPDKGPIEDDYLEPGNEPTDDLPF